MQGDKNKKATDVSGLIKLPVILHHTLNKKCSTSPSFTT